uniref:Uncharacterized protein n=1 Tax=Lepeophtheirus salmonis TaxID=72036 RepID=A0A0K2VKL5_LEPSM
MDSTFNVIIVDRWRIRLSIILFKNCWT